MFFCLKTRFLSYPVIFTDPSEDAFVFTLWSYSVSFSHTLRSPVPPQRSRHTAAEPSSVVYNGPDRTSRSAGNERPRTASDGSESVAGRESIRQMYSTLSFFITNIWKYASGQVMNVSYLHTFSRIHSVKASIGMLSSWDPAIHFCPL